MHPADLSLVVKLVFNQHLKMTNFNFENVHIAYSILQYSAVARQPRAPRSGARPFVGAPQCILY